MSYKEKPQLKLYKFQNNSFVYFAIVDDYNECSWERNLYEAGTFSITINLNIPNANLFKKRIFVQFGNDPYDFGEILKIDDPIGSEGKGSQVRTITGKDARYILKRRIIKNLNNNDTWSMTGKAETCLRNLINDQCGANAEPKRYLPITNVITRDNNSIGKECSISEAYSNLYEVCKTVTTQCEIGWRLKFENNELTLEFYRGEDLSFNVKFSPDYDSLETGTFTDSLENFINSLYIGGKGQNEEQDIYEGEGLVNEQFLQLDEDKPYLLNINGFGDNLIVSGDKPCCLDRFEGFNNQSSMTTEEEYKSEAFNVLSQYSQTINVSGNGLAKSPYEYKKEYNVGDRIAIEFSGKEATTQILGVTECWGWASYTMQFSFGKPISSLNAQLQLILNKVQKASNKTNSTDSIKWYELPGETEMPASDVTYNTIGFTGTGTTFKLYLDDEKTGAKSYHVYMKNVTTSNVVLTTGKTGATNLTLTPGTYVSIVYVDSDGNVYKAI